MKNLLTVISIIFFFSCGEKNREEITERFDNGKRKIVIKFIGEGDSKQIIERIEYNYNSDTILLEKPLDNLKMVREYFSYGKILKEEHFKDLIKDGKSTYYYKNGHISSAENYKDGNKDRTWKFYYDNGQLKEEGNYKDDKIVGKWTSYFIDGQILYEINYKSWGID